MARKVTIKIDTERYREPTQEELDAARRYVIRRHEVAVAMRSRAEDLIEEAAADIARIALKYNIDATQFSFDSDVNEDMMREVTAVMDELEGTLLDELEEAATQPATTDGMKMLLLGLLLSLGHRDLGMRETLHQYLWRSLRQTEAIIAAQKAAGATATQTVAAVRSGIARPLSVASLQAAFRQAGRYRAPFISSGGKATYSDGAPNPQGVPVSGVQAVANTVATAVDTIWNRWQGMDMRLNGAIGYYQLRGSGYPCDPCDEETGFHELGDIENDPLVHGGCLCYRVPIYRLEELDRY